MFLLEGNIGVGKSTFLKLMQHNCPDITVVQEPQTSWSSQTYGQSLLENFYKDATRWAYTIETLAMVTRIKEHMTVQAQGGRSIMERSVYSGHYCFARNDYANGFLSPMEWDVYERLVDFLVHENCKPPQGFVYLRAAPEICYERIKVRNRKGEESMTFDYVAQIGMWHEKFLIEKEDVAANLHNVPVLILDANQNLLTDQRLLMEYLEQVKAFMQGAQAPRVAAARSAVV